MFVRRLKSKNGKTYVHVVDKSSGRYKVLKSFGSSGNKQELETLVQKARKWIADYTGKQEFDFSNTNELIEKLLGSITQMNRVGFDLLLGRIFDEIGFNQIDDPLFRQLALCRISYPRSKLKTTEYLYRYKQISWSENQVYRYLDKLYNTQKKKYKGLVLSTR